MSLHQFNYVVRESWTIGHLLAPIVNVIGDIIDIIPNTSVLNRHSINIATLCQLLWRQLVFLASEITVSLLTFINVHQCVLLQLRNQWHFLSPIITTIDSFNFLHRTTLQLSKGVVVYPLFDIYSCHHKYFYQLKLQWHYYPYSSKLPAFYGSVTSKDTYCHHNRKW